MAGWAQAVGVGASVIGNIFAARNAARAAKQAAAIEEQENLRQAEQARATANEVNPMIGEAYTRGQELIGGTAATQGDIVQQRGELGGQEAVGAAREANVLLDPYTGAGATAARSLSELAGPQRKFTAADLEMDPSYQFRLSEGQKALERSRAAQGVLAGGGTAKALTRYAQGAASQEYAAAFDRFMRGQDQRGKTLMDIAGLGRGAAIQAGTNLTGASQFAGELGLRGTTSAAGTRTRGAEMVAGLGTESVGLQSRNILTAEEIAQQRRIDAARARAGGLTGAANAWTGAVNNIGQSVQGGLSMWDLARRFPVGGAAGGGGSPGTTSLSGYYRGWRA